MALNCTEMRGSETGNKAKRVIHGLGKDSDIQ